MATKKDLIWSVSSAEKISPKQAAQATEAVLTGMANQIVDTGKLSLRNFGTFEVKEVKARECHNPRTGESFTSQPSQRVAFKASDNLTGLVKAMATAKKVGE